MNEILAWYRYPKPKGSSYFEEDLKQPDKVIQIFDYCQILLANITKPGWNFLIEHYGYEELFKLNNKSGWLDCDSLEEYKAYIQAEVSDGQAEH